MSWHRHTKKRTITAASALLVLGLLPVGGAAMTANAAGPAGNAVVYNATVTPLPGNLISQGFQATQTAELGDLVQLAGTNRVLRSATVTMSTWALRSGYPTLPDSGWTHPITFNVYNVDRISGTVPALGSLIGSITQTVAIPWRPDADPTCATPTAWRSTVDQKCYNGFAFNVTFDLSTIGSVPDEIIYGIAYNTNTWGAVPIGQPGPYESLNVGLNTASPTTGTDVEPGAVFWNTMTAANYSDGGPLVGTFRRDTGWTGYTPAVSLTASPTLVAPPTGKDQCLKSGWMTFNNPAFKNQGDCVSFVATGGKNAANG